MSDTCIGVSWETNGAHEVRATVRPVEEFPQSHPAAFDPATKTCLGLGASADAEYFAIPTVGATYDATTGACTSSTKTGGELLFNPDASGTSWGGIGKARTSRVVVTKDDAGMSYLTIVNGARGAASGGRVGIEIAGRDVAKFSSRPNNAGSLESALLHPLTPVASTVIGSCSLNSVSTEDCFAYDAVNGQAALRWAWTARAPEGAVIGPFPGTGTCVSLRWELGYGIDMVEVGSYDNTTGTVDWTDITAAATSDGSGVKLCTQSCGDHCLSRTTCGACGGDDACSWCPTTKQCVARAVEQECAETTDVIGECLETCGSAVSCATCAQRPGCGWCHTTGTCHGADVAGLMTKGGNGQCAAVDFAVHVISTANTPEGAATCEATNACPGARLASGVPAVVGHQPVHATCNGRGTCDAVSRKCACAKGYAGEACEIQCKGPSLDAPCANRGACDKRDGTCHCKPGFEGVDCNTLKHEVTPTCECGIARLTRLASGAEMQVCTGRLTGTTCSCREGWTGADCDLFCPGAGPPALAADPDSAEAFLCGGRGVCPPAAGSLLAQCACDDGYTATGVGGVCVAATCAAGTCPESRGNCVFDVASSAMACVCRGGYIGQGCNTCACKFGGTCNDITAECECPPGQTGKLCEESEPATGAVRDAYCENGGEYVDSLRRCSCALGFIGEKCDVACDSDTDCSGNGVCDATVWETTGSSMCTCATGFSGDTLNSECNACATGFVDYPHCAAAEEAGSDVCHDSTDAASLKAYRGMETRTMDGRACQSWDQQTPVEHGYDPTTYTTDGIGAHNHCRNPTGDLLPWCFIDRMWDVGISVPTRRRDEPIWGYCGVVDCFDLDNTPANAPQTVAQCAVVGEMTMSGWTQAGALAHTVPRGKGSDANCAAAALNDLHVGSDYHLHGTIQIRTAMTTNTAQPYVHAVAFEEITGSADANDDRPAIVIYADGTVEVGVGGTYEVASLPFAGDTDASPVITAFTQTAFSTTGVTSKIATAMWIDGTVVNIVSTECAECALRYRLDVNVKVLEADGVAAADSICGGAGADIADANVHKTVACNTATNSQFGDVSGGARTCPTDYTATAAGYCTTARTALAASPPSAESITVGTAACRQCARVGGTGNANLESACLTQVAALGGVVAGPFADLCRARFVNERGYERAVVLDTGALAWDGASLTGGGATLRDTVETFGDCESFPCMTAFRMAAAYARTYTEEEFTIANEVRYVAGVYRDVGSSSKTRGLPVELEGTTVGRATWPFPSIEDKCRGTADIATGGGGFALYNLVHDVSYVQKLRIRACDTTFPSEVALYTKDYLDVDLGTVTVNEGDGTISFDFTPWRDDVDAKYEVRIKYTTTAADDEVYTITTTPAAGTATTVGDWSLPLPVGASTGDAGFETGRITVADPAVAYTVTMTGATGVNPNVVTIISITITAENVQQTMLEYPPYAGYRQVACGTFSSTTCGDMFFDAAASTNTITTEYLVAVTGRGVAEGTFDIQVMKLYGQLTMLRSLSSNAATSSVISADGSVVRALPNKVAKFGDTLTVRVESGRPIDKPILTVNSVVIRPGLVVGAGRNWEATFVLQRAHGYTDGMLNVTATVPATMTEPARGFVSSELPKGADKALVIFDGTPPTLIDALMVNVAYVLPLDSRALDACTASDDVTMTTAKHASVGDVVGVVFRASEPLTNVKATIGGLTATVLMDQAGAAPTEVKQVRDAWRVSFGERSDSATYPSTDSTFGIAYVELTDEVIRQGTLVFEVTFSDAAGNRGAPVFTVTGAPASVSAASALNDRLRSDSVVFDSFVPRPASRRADGVATANVATTSNEAVLLSYLTDEIETANVKTVSDSFHDINSFGDGALAYRLGDVIVADVAWTEPVTRPYGAYFQLSAGGRQHIKQSDIVMRSLARAIEPGKAQCRQREFRPRAQELVSRAAGWGGRNSFELTELASEWRTVVTLADPCDVVGRGALAWSKRNDCRAEDRGDGSFWIPMWARWCREGWGVMGVALPEAYDAAGNVDGDSATGGYLKLNPTSVNNAQARSSTKTRAVTGDAVVRAPVVLAGKDNPLPGGIAIAGTKQPMNTPPSMVELYAEPSEFTWNMYRRVVKAGDYVVFHMFFDQPVLRVKLWIGDHETTKVVRHENIAPAYQVYKPCTGGALNNWLTQKGLVALEETFVKPQTWTDADDDFLDTTIRGNFASRVTVGADSVPCTGFWVLKGAGGYRVKRLCARRKILLDAAGLTMDATCSDSEDRIYISAAGFNYHAAKVTLTDAMLDNSNNAQPDGPIWVKWQLMSAYNGQWGAVTESHTRVSTDGFFGEAQTLDRDSVPPVDVADVIRRVGDAFDPAKSCNRDAVVNYDQPGSSVWVAVDTTAPTQLVPADIVVTVSSPQVVGATDLVASRGDVVTVVVTYDEQIDPNDAFAYFTTGTFNRKLTPSLVYYNVVTYTLTVGTHIPALDAQMKLTLGPVSDVVGNTQPNGDAFTTTTFASGVTVTTQSRTSDASLPVMWSLGYDTDFSCTTESSNTLDDRVAGPGHVFTLVLQTSTSISVASAIVAGIDDTDAGVTVTVAASDNGVANGKITVTRTVAADATPTNGNGFVDGASVNWKLSLVTSTRCLDDTAGPCDVAFDVTACPTTFDANGAVTAWEDRIYVDLTPPTLTSLKMVSASNFDDGAVVRNTEDATVTLVMSEPLLFRAANVLPKARLVVDCGGAAKEEATADLALTLEAAGNGVAANTYKLEFTGGAAIGTAPDVLGGTVALTSNCQTSQLCLDFVTGVTDTAGNALATTQYCIGFGHLLTQREPGWLLYDNMARPTSVVVSKVPHSCADSSISAADCTITSNAAATHPGSWFTVTMSAATPTALSSVSFGGKEHVSELPRAGESFVLNGCTDAAPVARCEAFAARRGACEAFLCPTCAWRHSCDFSCGYCQTGRGAGTSATLTFATTEFPALAEGDNLVFTADVRTTGKDSGRISVNTAVNYVMFTPGFSPALTADNSCAGRCGGDAPQCGCDAGCVIDGDCCADAGLCCAVNSDSPSAGAVNVEGGCLLPPALALATPTVTSWADRSDGVQSTFATPGSTVYLLVTANKPIDVSRVMIGGVDVDVRSIAVEYDLGALALERSATKLGRMAYDDGDDTSFSGYLTDVNTARARLPGATIPYTPSVTQKSRVYPNVPDTKTALIRIDGQKLVPQPDGALAYSIYLTEKSYNPFFTDGTEVSTLTGNGPVWKNTPVLVTITGTKVSGAGGASVVPIGTTAAPSTISVDVTANVDVVVTSFTIEAVPLTCRGVVYGGDLHGDCAVDPRLEWPDTTDLAEYQTDWSGTRTFDEKERGYLTSGAIRVCVSVIDVAGNKASTCVNLNLQLDVDPPTCIVAPVVVSKAPTGATFDVEMSEPGTVKWTAKACQTGSASGDVCDAVDASVAEVTGQTIAANAPAATTVVVSVPAWSGDVVMQVTWELCDDVGECGPCAPTTTEVYLPAAADPTVTPSIVNVEPTTVDVSLQHGGGSTQACWAVLEMDTATTAADAPARTKLQTCAPETDNTWFTSPLWCSGTNQAHTCGAVAEDRDENPVGVSQLTSASHYCLYAASSSAADTDAASVVCFSTADNTAPTFTVIRGTSRWCDGNKIVGPKCRLVIGVIASECVTQPTVTLTTWGTSPFDETGFNALPETTRPAIEVQPTSGQLPASAGCDTTWMFTYGPGLADYLQDGNLQITVGGCTDMAPFGWDGAPASLSLTQGANACPTETIAPTVADPSAADVWVGYDAVNLVIDNTPPAPTSVTTVRGTGATLCALGGDDTAVITVVFGEATSRPTFTCMSYRVLPAAVTVPGATSTTSQKFSTTWAARCIIPRGLAANTALEYTYTNLADKYGNVDSTIFTQATVGPTYGSTCTIKSTKPVLILADFDVPVVKPGEQVVLSLEFSEAVTQPPVTIAGVAVTPVTADGGVTWTITENIPANQPDGPLPFTVGPDVTDTYGNKNPREYIRPQGTSSDGSRSDRPLVDGTAPVLRLISFVSNNAFNDKMVIEGDIIRLTFEANEFVTEPTVTVGSVTVAANDVTPVFRAGVAARGFIDPQRTNIAVTYVAEVTVDASFAAITGDIPWTATAFTDVAGNAGTATQCGDWLPACAAVYVTQTALERDAHPAIDSLSGDAVSTFLVPDFLALSPVTTMYTLFYQNQEVTGVDRVNYASEMNLRQTLPNFDHDAGAFYLAQHVVTSHLLFQVGGACGAANGPNCHATCDTCDDGAVQGGPRTRPGLDLDGDSDRGGACAPTLSTSESDVVVWFIGVTDGRPVSKPTVRFRDTAGASFLVNASLVTPADATITRPALPTYPCEGVLNVDLKIGDGVCDPDLNFPPCFDGGDCCEGTCGFDTTKADVLSIAAACGTNSFECLDRGIDPVTGNDAEGVWKTYNDAVVEGTVLSTAWRVEVSLGSDTATGLQDGLLLGEVQGMRDDAGDDPFGNDFDWVGSAAAGEGANCLQATLSSEPSKILEAEFLTNSGDLLIGRNDEVKLALTISGVPRVGPNCTIAGVASNPVIATRVANDAGSATDASAANSTWHCMRASLFETDSDIEYLIGLEEAPIDPSNQRAPEDINDCTPVFGTGVETRWVVDFTDAAGFEVKGATSADFDVNQVCFDYDKPDVTRIWQDTTNDDPRFAKAGDTVFLTVYLDRPIDLPTRAVLALADCVPNRVGTNAFECPHTVTAASPEGPVVLLVEGMVATDGAQLPTVNFTYTNVWPTVIVDQNDPTVYEPNVPVIIDVTPPTFEELSSVSETGPGDKQCSACCRLRVTIATDEPIQTPTVTVAGVVVAAVDVTGSDEVWTAVVELCDTTIPEGPISVCVAMEDLAGNPTTSCDLSGPDEGDDEPVDRVYGTVPLRACLMSNRAGFPGLGKDGDVLSLQLDTSAVVSISAVTIGPNSDIPSKITVAPYSGHVVDANGRAMRWQADTMVTQIWGDMDPVLWSITYTDTAGASTTLNNITGCFVDDPEKVVIDAAPPTVISLNVTTTSPWDPTASKPYEITLCVVASEPVVAPMSTILTGFGPFPPAMVTGGGTEWCMGPRVVLPTDTDYVDANGCIKFSVTLTDLSGNVGVANTALVGQEGTALCPTTRVELDLTPPIFLWLNIEVISSTDMVFDAALNEPCEVFFVAVPQGSAEPTVEEVISGTGASGAAAVSKGKIDYIGSIIPSPSFQNGGIGLQQIVVPDLSPGVPYDLYFIAVDRFGQKEPRARSRRLSSLGVWTPATSVAVAEGDVFGDVVVLQLTQPPTEDVDVILTASQPDQLLFALETNALVFTENLVVRFPRDEWSVATEVKVKAFDDKIVEGPHVLRIDLSTTSIDPRYDSLSLPPLRAAITDNDIAAVIISDPREALQTREMVCDGVAPNNILEYETDEATAVDALVWLAGAPSTGDDVVVTLQSGNVAWMAVTGVTGGAGGPVVLTFDSSNYDHQISVKLIPVYSNVADPNRIVDLIVDVTSSSAPYSVITVPDIPVTIIDLQTPGITFSRTKIREAAGSHEITMRLESEPRANVVVDFTVVPDPNGSHNYANLAIQPASVTITPDDFGSAITVTFVTGDDGTYYGDVEYDIHVTFTSVGDVEYANLVAPDLSVTVLEGDPEPAWIVADVTGVTRLVAPVGSPPLPPVEVLERTQTLRYTVRPAGNLWKSVTITPTFAPDTRQRGVITPQRFTFTPGQNAVAQFALRFPSNTAVLGDLDVVIWHIVENEGDEPGYRALNPNLGAGALEVTMIETDTAGFSLGNGVTGVILVEEPENAGVPAVPTPPGSFGVVLKSKPIGVVSVDIFEAINATDLMNPTAVAKRRRYLLADNVAVASADQQMVIVSGSTLTFTELDWFIPKEVVLAGIWKDGDQGRRTVTFCSEIDAPDDPVYRNANAPCFNTVLTEYGDEDAPIGTTIDLTVEVEVEEVAASAISSLPTLYQRFTKFWQVRAWVATCTTDAAGTRTCDRTVDLNTDTTTEIPIASLTDPVEITFQVDESYFSNRSGVDAMYNEDPSVNFVWSPVMKNLPGVDLVWGATDSVTNKTEVTGRVLKTGTYFLGQAFPALVVYNPTTAPLFKEKGSASDVLRGLTIQPADIAVDYPVNVNSATLAMKRFNPASDILDIPFCNATGQNITEGCYLRADMDQNESLERNIFAIYFAALGELSVMSADEVPVNIGSGRRRKLLGGRRQLLQTVTEPTTDEYADVLSEASFSDPDVDPSGEPRQAVVSVTDDSNQVASGPEVEIPTEPTNDLPNVFLQSCFVVQEGIAVVDPALNLVLPLTYHEKETVFLSTQTIVFDPDGTVLTGATVTFDPAYEANDIITYSAGALERTNAFLAAGMNQTDFLPSDLSALTITITSATQNPGLPNRVQISGSASFAAYVWVFNSLQFTNMGPLITNVQRKITYTVTDSLGDESVLPAGLDVTQSDCEGYLIMDLINVNDPPVANAVQTVLVISQPGGTADGLMLATDPDGPTFDDDGDPVIWYNITCFPSKGIVEILDVNTGSYRYTHDPDLPGTDTFVFFAWDGELVSRFATVTVRTGTGDAAPESAPMEIEVWENSATVGQMLGTDPDGSDDIYRYQIVVEPESPASLVLTDEISALFRHNPLGAFTYTASSVSATVTRVAEAMANLPSDFDFNSVRGTNQHPGYHADSFQYKILDKAGMLSEVATVFINVRLTRESNTPPISSPIALSTVENVALSGASIKFNSLDAESPNNLRHEIFVTEDGVTPEWNSPVLGTITPLDPTNVNDARFVYTPHPFFHGVERVQYVAIDAHGATSTPVDLVVRPVKSCLPFNA